MARRSRLDILVADTLKILEQMGIPLAGLPSRRKEKLAKVFLAVVAMKPGLSWAQARSDHKLRTREIIAWLNAHLGEDISMGSYDDIRRKDLVLPIEAGLILRSAGNENAATNDGTRTYAGSPEMVSLLHSYGTNLWKESLDRFLAGRTTLTEQLRKSRQQALVPIKIGDNEVSFSPGEHNELQRAIIQEFLPRFGHGADVLYVGDTQDKLLFVQEERLTTLGLSKLSHEKLPDVLAYSETKNWLFVIEAVHSANPIHELRKRDIERMTGNCTASIVYVSAFLTRAAFRRFSFEIAWETEAWIAESPDHLIHFNGDKFLGPHAPVGVETTPT